VIVVVADEVTGERWLAEQCEGRLVAFCNGNRFEVTGEVISVSVEEQAAAPTAREDQYQLAPSMPAAR
jgi:hypothetical protein